MSVIGVDIGGTNVRAGRVTGGQLGDVVRRSHDGLGHGRVPYRTLLDGVLATVGELLRRGPCDAIGISMAGMLSLDRSVIISNGDWGGQPLGQDVAAATGCPVVMENDGNCAAWAEYVAGAGQHADPFTLLTLGTGVGGGTIANGRLVSGANGYAGELGHICVDTQAGLECSCGAFGCLEQYASGHAIIGRYIAGPRYRAVPGPVPDKLQPAQARAAEASLAHGLESGDPWAWQVLGDAAAKIAIGLSAIVRITDPAVVAISGGAAGLGEHLLRAVRQAAASYPGVESRRLRVRIELAHHPDHAGIIGSALLARERIG